MSAQIYACGNCYLPATEPAADLKVLVKETTGEAVRRIGRFIQLALIGAGRCAQGATVPADTAVYFASGRGDFETTLEVMATLFRDGGTPKPLSFVNTVSNAACYYVARSLRLQSRSNFVCNRNLAFESVLQLALMDVETHAATSALVGSVDAVTTPLAEYRQRLHLAADTPLAEGSHWLWIGPARDDRPRIGEVTAMEYFGDAPMLSAWIAARRLDAHDCAFATGQFIDAGDARTLADTAGLSGFFDYRDGRGYYDSQSGAAIADFLAGSGHTQLLHVNADATGGFGVMLVTR
ncbi:MAG: hypothetical protein WDO12_05505 [Pseudomonadota bacterium]